MSARTDERAQFLADVLTTAIEGGIDYWGAVGDYRWGTKKVEPFAVHDTFAVIYEHEDDNGISPHRVTLDTIAHGIAFAKEQGLGSSSGQNYVKEFWLADRTNGAEGDYDAEIAEQIVQIGIFGKMIFE